ncbi:MAG: carbohydrate kinase family protein [Clostridia bacterium]|nr:carbohydrate kinase family protein [Clostridia bacterium]
MDKEYICGVGAANVDIHGKSTYPIITRNSNWGAISQSTGGVTRNVLENLSRLGENVQLISSIGDDVFGEKIVEDCKAENIGIEHSYYAKNHPSSSYISVLNDDGDMFVALSDMSVINEMPLSHLEAKAGIIKGAKLVTIDPCLNDGQIEKVLDLCEEAGVPVFCDPVSIGYAKRIKPYVGRIHTIKPNELELEALTDVEIRCEEDFAKAAQVLLDRGVKRVFVSRGSLGAEYYDNSGLCIKRAFKNIKMVNATGAGDSFAAAVEYAFAHDFDIDKTLDYALAAGAAAVGSERTINPNISEELLLDIIKENKGE